MYGIYELLFSKGVAYLNIVKSITEYKEVLLNLEKLSFKIDINEVYEYYFMKFIFNTENLFFDDYQKMINKVGSYKEQFKPIIYNIWIDEYTQEKNQKICKALEKFIDSDDFRMDHSHFGKEFSMKNIEATS